MEDNTAAPVIIRMPEVTRTVGLSRATIYNRMRQGTFPAAVPLGDAAVGWLRSEVEQWIAERVSERDAQTSAAA
jgi:prophage regulatory protein